MILSGTLSKLPLGDPVGPQRVIDRAVALLKGEVEADISGVQGSVNDDDVEALVSVLLLSEARRLQLNLDADCVHLTVWMPTHARLDSRQTISEERRRRSCGGDSPAVT